MSMMDAKKWDILLNGRMEEFSNNDIKGLGELYIKAQKDRRIVKEIREWCHNHESAMDCFHKEQIEEILDE